MQNMIAAAFVLLLSSSVMAEPTDQQSVDKLFAAYEKPGSPGCSLGVIRDGAFVYSKGYGLASLELGVPLAPNSVFYMASVSKQFTAASIVLAAEQGFLSLDDDIHKYIPELPDYGEPITLREMLHHTSGLRDFLGLVQLSGRNIVDVLPAPEMLDLITRQKALNFRPGTEYLYSNTNYFLLAEVIKRATHKPLSVFAEENIFRPLGMSHTRFYDDRSIVVPGRVPAYEPGSNGSFKVDWSTNFDNVGDGGLMSSVDDLLLWDKNFYDNRLGKGTLLKEMQTRGILKDGKQIDYALGLEISKYRGLPIVEHGGALFGYRTEILRFPEQRFSIICLCNLGSANPGVLSRAVADLYLKSALAPAPVHAGETTSQKAAGSDARALAGNYENPKTHSAFQFSVAGDALQVYGMSLKSVGPDRFVLPVGPTVSFEKNNGKTSVKIENNGDLMFEGNKVAELHLAESQLQAFVGTYESTELDATYKLDVAAGTLMVHDGWNPPIKLEPLVPDEFSAAQFGTLVFHRNSAGRVTGLSVYSGRIRDVGFQKSGSGSKGK